MEGKSIGQLLGLLTVGLALFSTGCADLAETSGGTRSTLVIGTGDDARPVDAREPGWCENAEPLIARALRDKIRSEKLFSRVKTHAAADKAPAGSAFVRFRILKFDCASHQGFFESTGRSILRKEGLRGVLIDASIPTKYTAEVEIEFTVSDPSNPRQSFTQTYAATREITLNGYQGSKPLKEQMAAALEEVVNRFAAQLQSQF